MSYAGSATLKNVAKPRSSLLVHAYGHEVTGLKTYRGQKRKEQLGVCSLPGFYVPEVVGREFCLGVPDCSVVINNSLAIERRGGRGGGGTPMLVRSLARGCGVELPLRVCPDTSGRIAEFSEHEAD